MRVSLVAHKQSRAASHLPGPGAFPSNFDELSCDRWNRQHGGSVSHKLPGMLMVAHPAQACAPPPSLGSGQVSFPESSSQPWGSETRSGLPIEAETQIWDLFSWAEVDLFVSQESTQCPLWFSPQYVTRYLWG